MRPRPSRDPPRSRRPAGCRHGAAGRGCRGSVRQSLSYTRPLRAPGYEVSVLALGRNLKPKFPAATAEAMQEALALGVIAEL